MGRKLLSSFGWNSVITTTKATRFAAEGSDVRIYTGSTTGVKFEEGFLLEKGKSITLAAGLDVSAWPVHGGSAVTYIEGVVDSAVNWGWVDYNDTATQTVPIALTLANTFYNMTNDGLGGFTNKLYKPNGHGELWNVSTDRFDWSSLKLGDTVDIRYDFIVITSGPTRDINIAMDMAIGSGSDYSLPIDHHSYKIAGTYSIVGFTSVYMGDNNTLNNPAKFSMSSDGVGETVKVNGWYGRTLIR